MKSKLILTWPEVIVLAEVLAFRVNELFEGSGPVKAYGVPRGGCIVSPLVQRLVPVDTPEEADLIVDDLIDSGTTLDWFEVVHAGKPFLALVDKRNPACPSHGRWVVFPWEKETEAQGPEDNVRRILQLVGENPDREGLIETPKRFLKMLAEMTSGYGEDPKLHLDKRFTLDDESTGMSGYDEIIFTGPLPFVSMCEHHIAAFDGVAFIGYIPDKTGGVVGLSKLARLLDGYAKRLQVQERLTLQIIDAIESALAPKASAVVLRARHTCQCFRGVKKDGRMITSAMRGAFRESPAARAEFFELIRLSESGK